MTERDRRSVLPEVLDAVDAKILDLIQHDAGLSVADIAERVGLSSSPCWRRIKRLEDAGVIQRRVTLLDGEKLGLAFEVYAEVKLNLPTKEKPRRVRGRSGQTCPKWPNCATVTGGMDYVLRIVTRDMHAFEHLHARQAAFPRPGLQYRKPHRHPQREELHRRTARPHIASRRRRRLTMDLAALARLTAEQLALLVGLFLPGFVSIKIDRLIHPGDDVKAPEMLIDAFGYSVINAAFLSGLIILLIQAVNGPPNFQSWWLGILIYLVGPCFWPILFRIVQRLGARAKAG